MKSPALRRSSALLLSIGLATSAALAAPADDLTAAAKKLADAPSYGWTTTTEMANSQFPAMPADGVTEKGGFTVITRSFNDTKMQTVRKGTEIVSQNRDGDWLNAEEIRAQFGQRGGGGGGTGGGGGGGGQRGGGGGGRGGAGGGMFGGGAANPAEQVANYAAKLKDVKAEDGALIAVAKGEEAAALLAPAGGRGGQGGGGGGGNFGPKYTSVTMKFWVKDGTLTKYSVHSLGTVSFNGEERELDTTTTTEIKSVGSAKVEVPEAAKKKFTN